MVIALDWLIIIAFAGLVLVCIGLAVALVNLKNQAVAGAKRIYERPADRVKIIAATGKGIAQQEVARAQRAADHATRAGRAVGVVVDEARQSADILREADLQTSIAKLRDVIALAAAFQKVVQAAQKNR